jgi:hypothetical protein
LLLTELAAWMRSVRSLNQLRSLAGKSVFRKPGPAGCALGAWPSHVSVEHCV